MAHRLQHPWLAKTAPGLVIPQNSIPPRHYFSRTMRASFLLSMHPFHNIYISHRRGFPQKRLPGTRTEIAANIGNLDVFYSIYTYDCREILPFCNFTASNKNISASSRQTRYKQDENYLGVLEVCNLHLKLTAINGWQTQFVSPFWQCYCQLSYLSTPFHEIALCLEQAVRVDGCALSLVWARKTIRTFGMLHLSGKVEPWAAHLGHGL